MDSFFQVQSQRAMEISQAVAAQVRRVPGATVLEDAWHAYGEDRCSMIAAALSYYALLSLFPLMLFILAMSSPFLQSEAAIRSITGFISQYMPTGALLLRKSLDEVTQARGTLTLVAALGFLWSSSGVFDLIQLGLNRAFCVKQPRPLWRQRIVSLGMVVMVTLLFGFGLLATSSLRLAVHYGLLPRNQVALDYLQPVLTVLLGTLIFGMMYRYVPYDPSTRWRHIWVSALLASVSWEIAKWSFAWYLTNLAVLNLVYGSLGAIIAVMLWGYVTATILLLGAELAATMAGVRRREKPANGKWTSSQSQEQAP